MKHGLAAHWIDLHHEKTWLVKGQAEAVVVLLHSHHVEIRYGYYADLMTAPRA